MPVPDVATDDTEAAVVSICGPVWVRPASEKLAAFPPLSFTVAPLRLTAVAASAATWHRSPRPCS